MPEVARKGKEFIFIGPPTSCGTKPKSLLRTTTEEEAAPPRNEVAEPHRPNPPT